MIILNNFRIIKRKCATFGHNSLSGYETTDLGMREFVWSIKGRNSDRVKLAIKQVQNTPLQVKVLDSK